MRVVTVEGKWRGGRGRGSWQEWRPPPPPPRGPPPPPAPPGGPRGAAPR